jgi:hypothetical protein
MRDKSANGGSWAFATHATASSRQPSRPLGQPLTTVGGALPVWGAIPPEVACLHGRRQNPLMGRDREQSTPDLFSTDTVRDTSLSPLKSVAATHISADTSPQRHVLPKNLRKAVKHLSDSELVLLHAATTEELERRGRFPLTDQITNRTSGTDKSPHKRQAETAPVSLTRGQINAVRAAFKAGIKPSVIARQFRISQSDVRKVLASDATVRGGSTQIP